MSKAATSASTACASSARAALRKTSVSGSAKVPGWESGKTLVSNTAYHSFGGEVEASSTPTIRRLIPPCRHQLLPIARDLASEVRVTDPVSGAKAIALRAASSQLFRNFTDASKNAHISGLRCLAIPHSPPIDPGYLDVGAVTNEIEHVCGIDASHFWCCRI